MPFDFNDNDSYDSSNNIESDNIMKIRMIKDIIITVKKMILIRYCNSNYNNEDIDNNHNNYDNDDDSNKNAAAAVDDDEKF